MVSTQERFLIKSALWWRAYGNWTTVVAMQNYDVEVCWKLILTNNLYLVEKLRDAIYEAFTAHNFYVAITVSNVIS